MTKPHTLPYRRISLLATSSFVASGLLAGGAAFSVVALPSILYAAPCGMTGVWGAPDRIEQGQERAA